MKHFKSLLSVVVFALALTFTSCMNGDNGPDQYVATVSVESNYGYTTLLSDDGYTFTPTNGSILENAKRAIIYYQLAEGEAFTEGKTKYSITIVGGQMIPTKTEFVNEAGLDTLQHKPIQELGQAYAVNGYLTMSYSFNYNNKSAYFDMIEGEVVDNVYRMHFNYNNGNVEGHNFVNSYVMSFRLPSSIMFDRLGMTPDSEGNYKLCIVADSEAGEGKLEKEIKYKPSTGF